MVSSSATPSIVDGKEVNNFNSTASGLMVANRDGENFITMAAHAFEDDGLVWNPAPHQGKFIGNNVKSIPDTDIAVVQPDKGLRYTNHTLWDRRKSWWQSNDGLSPNYPPHTLISDIISMDNPYSGFCEVRIIALGAKRTDSGTRYIIHTWLIMQNREEVIHGSCDSAMLDENNRIVGVFRYMSNDDADCFAVSATELRERGYEICDG